MKQFDLDAAKRGEPIQTRRGKPVKFIAHVPDAPLKSHRLVVFVNDCIQERYENGSLYDTDASNSDLFMAPIKRTLWVNLYVSGGQYTAGVHTTKQRAEESYPEGSTAKRIGNRAWPLEIEE